MCWSSSLTPQVCTPSMGEWVGGARFFPLGTSPGGKNFALPPTDRCPRFLTRACPPQLSFVPQNFKNFTSLFSEFWLPFSSKLHRRALFYAWNTKICSNFAVGVHYWPQQTIFPNPPSSDSVPDVRAPPSDFIPDGDQKSSLKATPHQKFCEKTLEGGQGTRDKEVTETKRESLRFSFVGVRYSLSFTKKSL